MKIKSTMSAIVILLTTTLLAGCFGIGSSAKDDGRAADLDTATIQAEKTISVVSGTPAEQVQEYTLKAKEAQAKLQLLLEKQAAEQAAKKSSYFQLVPTTYAQDATTVEVTNTTTDEIDALLAEIETYTGLATEAVKNETDPEVVANLLDTVQETQAGTAEVLDGVVNGVNAKVAAVIKKAAKRVAANIEEVDNANAEVADAIASGAPTVSIDIETDVGDMLATGRPISLSKLRNHKDRAERKIAQAVREAKDIRNKMIANGVDPAEVDGVFAEMKARVDEAQSLAVAGNYEEAASLAKKGKRELKKVKNFYYRVEEAKKRFKNVKKLAESGDPVAIEELDRLAPLVEGNKDLKERFKAREGFYQKHKAEFRKERADFREERAGARREFIDLKRQEALGELDKAAFRAKKAGLDRRYRDVRQERNVAEREFRKEHLEKLAELKGLPPEEINTKRAELRKEFTEQRDRIFADQKELRDTLKAGDEEAVKALRKEYRQKREQARIDRREKFEAGVLKKFEALPPKEQEKVKKQFEAVKARRDENKTKQEEFRKEREDKRKEVQQDRKDFREERKGDKKDFREGVQQGRKDLREERKDFQKKKGEDGRDFRDERKGDRKEQREIQKGERKELKEAIETGDTEAAKKIREGRQEDRKDFREEHKKEVKDFREGRQEDRKDFRENRREEVKANRGEVKQIRKDLRKERKPSRTIQDLPSATTPPKSKIDTNQDGQVDRKEIKDARQKVRESREELKNNDRDGGSDSDK